MENVIARGRMHSNIKLIHNQIRKYKQTTIFETVALEAFVTWNNFGWQSEVLSIYSIDCF